MATSPPEDRTFARGTIVLVTLNNPREKFWGVILELTAAGLGIRGIELNSFEDFAGMICSGEAVTAGAVFFPMGRVERIDLDAPSGSIPSLADQFAGKTGRDAAKLLEVAPSAPLPGCTLAEAERRFVEATLASLHYDLARAAQSLGITVDDIRRVLALGPESGAR